MHTESHAQIRHQEQLKLAEEVLRSFGKLRFGALGASMVPAVFPGDVLTVQREEAQNIEIGDVVLCVRNGRFCAHRVVGGDLTSSAARWITRGDALNQDDSPAAHSEVLGRVILVERSNGKQGIPRQPSGFARLLQWGVRHSDALLRVVLAGHFSYQRLAGRAFRTRARRFPGDLLCKPQFS